MSYISSYEYSEQMVKSPNGKFTAKINNICEFQMSGPTYGDLTISNGTTASGIGVSVRWSDDSQFIAAPEFNAERLEFKIVIFDVLSKKKRYAAGSYGPIAIKKFSNNKLVLINSDETEIQLDISKIKW